MAILQTRAELHRESIRCPHGFRRTARAGLIFGWIGGVGEALGQRGNLASQRTEHVEVGHSLADRNLPRAKGAQPQRSRRDWAGNAPANNQQRNQNDEEALGQHPEKCLTPGEKNLGTDVAHIVHHGQAAQHFILTANRQRENVNRHASQSEERTLSVTLRDGLRNRRRGYCEGFREIRGRGYQRALPVIDDDAQHVLAVSEQLHQPLQFVVWDPARTRIPRPLNIADETLPNHLDESLLITAKSALLLQHLVIRETRRNQSDAENKRRNKANTQQTHELSFYPRF